MLCTLPVQSKINMKNLFFASLVILLFSCKQSPKNEDTVVETPQDTQQAVTNQSVQQTGKSITAAQAMERAMTEKLPTDIVAMWHAEEGLGATLFLYKDAKGALRMRTAFLDGNSMDNPITESKAGEKTRYDDDLGKGEYYLVEPNGNLGLYGDEGKFDEAILIK
jgi:hypothetical protein